MSHYAPVRFAQSRAFQHVPTRTQGNPFERMVAIRQATQQSGIDSGHGWERTENIVKHLNSEVQEFAETITQKQSPQRQLDELGDVLYVASMLGYRQQLDPEAALQHAADKYISRCQTMDNLTQDPNSTWYGSIIKKLHPDQRRALWEAAKQVLKRQQPE